MQALVHELSDGKISDLFDTLQRALDHDFGHFQHVHGGERQIALRTGQFIAEFVSGGRCAAQKIQRVHQGGFRLMKSNLLSWGSLAGREIGR